MGKQGIVILPFAVALLLLSACTSVMKAYPGPELPSTQTALVQGGAHTRILSLDAHPVTSQELSVLPGSHTITMRIFDPDPFPISEEYAFYSLWDSFVTFVAEPGHRYEASVEVVTSPFPISGESYTGFRWMGYVRDRTNNKMVANTDYLPVGVRPRAMDLWAVL